MADSPCELVSDDSDRKRRAAGMKAGAVTAGLLLFLMVMVPTTLAAIQSGFYAAWWPVILLFTMPWVGGAAAMGGFAGRFAAHTSHTVVGAAIGLGCSFPIAIPCAILFISDREPPGGRWWLCAFAGIIGLSAGAAATVFARSATNSKKVQFSLFDSMLFFAILATLFGLYAHQVHRSSGRSRVTALGGTVTWDAVSYRQRRWLVSFRDTELNDTELHSVISTLSDYQPLELDLGKTRVTDAGILQLADLEKLIRVSVGGTAVSDAATARLKRAVPNVEICTCQAASREFCQCQVHRQ